MRTRITRPTLAELWRVLLGLLEGLGADDASGLARHLAVAGLIGRPAEAMGVGIERRGEDVLVTVRDPLGPYHVPLGRRDGLAHIRRVRRKRVLAVR